jgi:hypothetical protein
MAHHTLKDSSIAQGTHQIELICFLLYFYSKASDSCKLYVLVSTLKHL